MIIHKNKSYCDPVLDTELNALSDHAVKNRTLYNALISKARASFNSVADMKACLDLTAGEMVCTKGYYEPNDGGNACYYLRTKTNEDVEDNGSIIFISDTNTNLVAELMIDNGIINVKQFGAKGDGVTDTTNAFQDALTYAKTNGYKLSFPKGVFCISSDIEIDGVEVYGQGASADMTKILYTADCSITSHNNRYARVGSINDMFLDADNKAKIPLKITNTDHAKYSNLRIQNALEDGVYIYSTQWGWVENLELNHVFVSYSGHNAFRLETIAQSGFINECVFYQCEVRGVSRLGNGYNAIRVDNIDNGAEISCIQWFECNFDAQRKTANDNGFEIGEICRIQNTSGTSFKCIAWSFIGGGWETTTNYPYYTVDSFYCDPSVLAHNWLCTCQNMAGWGHNNFNNIDGQYNMQSQYRLWGNTKFIAPYAKVEEVDTLTRYEKTLKNNTLVEENFEFDVRPGIFNDPYKTTATPWDVRVGWQEIEISLVAHRWTQEAKAQYYHFKYLLMASNLINTPPNLVLISSDTHEDYTDYSFTITPTVSMYYDTSVTTFCCKVNVNVVPPTGYGTGGSSSAYYVRFSVRY